ncbi:MAG: protein kinase [Deltaproteobacteria bacterium]|nr:protein kinase [Deltaproteobacteria bacterium]
MSRGTDDTEVEGGESGHDPTLAASDAVASGGESGPRIRPSQPSPHAAPDYPELLEVDPAHYVINREIARGGMGRIQVARDRRLGRDVAVKEVLTRSGSHARRFEREVRITAQLQHPSIISIHEAGTWPTGEPFYAMRLVHGRSLDEVIAAAKTFNERLALLPNVLAIADAMAYAHGQRVIHRDLKPRNIVVGEFGETVVIDWGLAKKLAHAEIVDEANPDEVEPGSSNDSAANEGETTVGDVLGTPAYMPPEQAAGRAVDERADVYAIGAILYHVLAARAPFVAESNAELIAAVYTGPPEPLLDLAPSAPRELVTIVERAMARDPAQRYATAQSLADDLRRFQTGQLVGAHRYSLRQLLGRWFVRQRTAVIAGGSAAVVAVVIGIVALRSVIIAEQLAEDQRSLAIADRKTAEGLMQFMLEDLHPRLEQVGKLDLLDTVARRAAKYYDARGDAGSDEDLLLSAKARSHIADVMVSRGDLRSALSEQEKAKAMLQSLVARSPTVVKYQAAALEVEYEIGAIQAAQGNGPAALLHYREALASAERLSAAHPNDPGPRHALHRGHSLVASAFSDRGDLDGALVEYRSALAAAAGSHELLNAHARLGEVLWLRDQVDEALREHRAALEIGEREAAKDPKNVIWLNHVAASRFSIGRALLYQKHPDDALPEFRASEAMYARLLKIEPSSTVAQVGRAWNADQIGVVLLGKSDLAGALVELRGGHAIWMELVATDPSNTDWQRGLSVLANKLGDVQLAMKNPGDALMSYRAALVEREKLVARDPLNEKWRRDLYYSHIKLAGAYAVMAGKQDEMIAELRKALAIADDSVVRNPTNSSSIDDLMKTHLKLGVAMEAAKDVESARTEYRAALTIAREAAAKPNANPSWQVAVDAITAELAKLDRTR